MKKTVIGIDIGGTNTKIGIVDDSGHIMIQESIATPDHGDIDRFIDDIRTVVTNQVQTVKSINQQSVILGIGVGAPNGNYRNGTIEYAPNLSFKGVVPMVALLKKALPEIKLISLTNDAKAATMGELIYGGAKGLRDFILFTLGTGVGSGLVVNGELVYGHDGFAGECGHTTLIPDGRLCGCGSRGHVETYCSAVGMKRTAFELMARDNRKDSLLANYSFNELSAQKIYEAALAGDPVALAVFELTGHWLGMALANTVHHTSPSTVFLFGGPVAAGELLLKPVRESLEFHLLPIFKNKIKVLPSALSMGDAAILGASALIFKEVGET